MENLFDVTEAKKYAASPLELRAYTSRLLGQNSDLVLQGGGNTSVKHEVENFFGEKEEILYVKGSGHDLKTITAQGFSPVKLAVLKRLAGIPELSDSDMIREQKLAMIDQSAPGPSVEAILHAIIPFKYVDHTHADAVVTLTNTARGREIMEELYGKKVLLVPYVMPGFILARKVFELTQDFSEKDWQSLEGMVLLNHGIFTFHDDAKISYDRMIKLVSQAEDYLAKKGAQDQRPRGQKLDLASALTLAQARHKASALAQRPLIARFCGESLGTDLGPLTPDHVIYTKAISATFDGDTTSLDQFARSYEEYFEKNKAAGLKKLDSAPRMIRWKNKGFISLGNNPTLAQVVEDISLHTAKCAHWAQALGGHRPLPLSDLFQVEYWELEQAKLKKIQNAPDFEGQVVLITGAASGIGKKSADEFLRLGAAVIAVDINPEVKKQFQNTRALAVVADITAPEQMQEALIAGVSAFGGLDILVLNAGIFPPSMKLEEMKDEVWQRSLDINLSSAQRLISLSIPFLKLGQRPSIAVIASKNVPAPGPGASHYSVAKAGLTQLARVAALELAPFGINVNVLHPNNVFDTGIWTEEVLKSRAAHYKMTVDEYKKNNLLKTEITSLDVAQMVTRITGPNFRKVTGAQIPLDGGNERVI